MLHVKYYPFELAFEYPFTTAHGTKTHQPTLVVSLGLGKLAGYGEAPAISYYNVTVEGMIDVLEAKKGMISQYALTEPERFWHFLHHLIPGEHFLTAALDIAAWDLFSQMRRVPLYKLLFGNTGNRPLTDYTIGIASADEMVRKMKAKPWPIYKVKLAKADDIDLLRQLRANTDAAFRVDANEGWSFEDAKRLLPELKQLGVGLVEQPLHRDEVDAMKELKAVSDLPLYADESCILETDVEKCKDLFHGINIKLTKCGGITPALRMIQDARKSGLKVMMGAMCESSIGSAAIAHLAPALNEMDADGPLLLKEDIAEGLRYDNGKVIVSEVAGLGIRFKGNKFER
jgi:L-Ala-D/L-Glu epimerase